MIRITLFITLIALLGCRPSEDSRIAQAVMEVRNSDIKWEGNYFGLQPTVHGKAAQYLLDNPQPSRRRLFSALDDPERFVAAHVLLTLMKEDGQYSYSASQSNGLRIDLEADGNLLLFPEQRFALKESWRTKQ